MKPALLTVKRVADYPWSSSPYYAYQKKALTWLTTGPILNQLKVDDQKAAYRRKVQQYANQKTRIWEDVKHGLIYGSQNFVNKIKATYLSDSKLVELPQHNNLRGDLEPEQLLRKMAVILNCDLESLKQTRRVSPADRDKRDMMIYYLWKTGALTNGKIGELFGLTYSSVSHRVRVFSECYARNAALQTTYKKLKSQNKI